MKKLISPIQLSLLLATVVLMSACTEEPKKTDDNEEVKEEQVVVNDDFEEVDDVAIMLPSPIQIANIFSNAGLRYQDGLVNPPSNVDKYNTKTAKYLNFGVYSADLAYAVLNDKQQAAIEQLNAVKTMSDAIGMSSIFGTGELIKSFEKNISNQDTVLYILTEIKQRTDAYLEENAEESKDAIFFSAAWVEGMYLGANSIDKKGNVTPRLIEQMTILKTIIRAINAQNDPTLDITFLIDGLKEINQYFNDIAEVQKYNRGEIELEDLVLNPEELDQLKRQITDLRTQIISG